MLKNFKFINLTCCNNDVIVMKNLIKYNFKKSVEIDLCYNMEKPILDIFITLLEIYYDIYSIQFYFRNAKLGKIIAGGDGVSRLAIDKALSEFKNLYIIYSTFPSFNFDNLSKLSDDKLFALGKFLHYIISILNNCIPFPLPICLADKIKNTNADEFTLEYYIKSIDLKIFNDLISIKNYPDKILETGHESYIDCLKFICGYPINITDIDTDKILNLIAKGFLSFSNIKNSDVMNLITLYNYICGNVPIDRESILKSMKFMAISKECDIDICIYNFKKIILNFTDEQLKIMLRNLTGFSSHTNRSKYLVYFSNEYEGIKFVACSKELYINPNIELDEQINILSTPIEFIVDDESDYFTNSQNNYDDNESDNESIDSGISYYYGTDYYPESIGSEHNRTESDNESNEFNESDTSDADTLDYSIIPYSSDEYDNVNSYCESASESDD